MRFKDKVAIVTGATREAGATIARRFANEGASVACLGRSAALGAEVAQSICDAGGRAIFVPTDMSIEQNVQTAVAKTVEAFGRVDVVVNHAAAQDLLKEKGEAPVTEEPSAMFDQIMKVNLYGPFWMAKYALPEMIKNGSGSFLSISSVNATRVAPAMPAYVASKSGLEGLTRQIANDFGRQGIRANSVALGSMLHAETAHIYSDPIQSAARNAMRMLESPCMPDDLANLLLFLASDEARFITGSVIQFDGGAISRYAAPPIKATGTGVQSETAGGSGISNGELTGCGG